MSAATKLTKARSDGRAPHSTATRLLECTVELLETEPMEHLSVAMVLERSGVSHGSLYHHYEDFPDLVEQALVHRCMRRLSEGNVAIKNLLAAADAAEFRAGAEALFREFIKVDRRRNRMDQVEVLGSLQGRPRLAERIAEAQRELNDERTAVFAEAQRRGFLRADLDPAALTGFLQGMVMCRVIDDVTDHHVPSDSWETVALIAFRAILFGD